MSEQVLIEVYDPFSNSFISFQAIIILVLDPSNSQSPSFVFDNGMEISSVGIPLIEPLNSSFLAQDRILNFEISYEFSFSFGEFTPTLRSIIREASTLQIPDQGLQSLRLFINISKSVSGLRTKSFGSDFDLLLENVQRVTVYMDIPAIMNSK